MSFSNFVKKLSACLILFVLLFTACTKETAQEQPRAGSLQILEYKSGDDITKFEYNADSTVSKVIHKLDPLSGDPDVTYTIKYLANKRIDEMVGSNGFSIKLSYDNNILSKSEFFASGVKVVESSFVYSGNQLASFTLADFINGGSVLDPFLKSTFEYNADGNASKTNLFGSSSVSSQLISLGYINSIFDKKINPFAKLSEITLVFWQFASKNNITKQEYFNNASLEAMVEYSYTYNMQGYPISGTSKITETGQPPVSTTLSYTYR